MARSSLAVETGDGIQSLSWRRRFHAADEHDVEPALVNKHAATATCINLPAETWFALHLLAFTGARKGEIASLRWSEVDLERGYIRLGDSKTGAKVFPIGAPAVAVLTSVPRLDGTAFVFPAASGGRSFQGVDKVWRKVRLVAGFPRLRIHDLRHSYASVGLSRGDALAVIGAILGHADVKTTSRYAHLADDPVRQAANAISQSVHSAFIGKPAAGVVPLRGGAVER